MSFQRIENLENRTLFSVIKAGQFGAAANDGRDDSAALRAAINAAKPGDTVQLAAGQFDFNSTVSAGHGVLIKGVRGNKTIVRSADRTFAFKVTGGHSAKFTNIKFDGSGITGEGQSTLNVDWCTFTNFTRGVNIGFGNGTALGGYANGWDPQNSHITNNSFVDSPGGWGIGFFRGNGVTIADNEFKNIFNGIKTNNGGSTAHDITVARNYMSGIRRMFAEMQGQVQNFALVDNFTENPELSNNYQENINSLGWSVIYHGDETRNVQIKRNTVLAPQRPDGTGVRMAFEVGNNAVVEDNYINGIGTFAPVFMGDSSGARSENEIGRTVVQNNKVINAKNGQGYSYGQWSRNAQFKDNGDDVKLSWNTNRGKPGPGKGESIAANEPPNEPAVEEQQEVRPGNDDQPAADPAPNQTPNPTPADANVSGTFVSSLTPTSAQSGWGQVEINQSNGDNGAGDGGTIAINGETYENGLGVAINSEVVYDLDGKFETFFSDIGIDDAVKHKGSMTFEVWADEKKVFESNVKTGEDAAESVKVEVKDVQQLKLVTTSAGDGGNSDHGNWAGARLEPATTTE